MARRDAAAEAGIDDQATASARPPESQATALRTCIHLKNSADMTIADVVGATPPQAGRVPALRALVLGFLGRHVESLVSLGSHLAPLPADIKACILCVARRRGVLSNRVLLALADEDWTLMDLAGATSLTERALRQAFLRCPHLRALDLSGLAATTPALLRDLPALCPSLELLAFGGCKTQEAAMLEVLPELIPHTRVREQQDEAVYDSWEDAVTGEGTPVPDTGIPCGLQRLKVLVWPHAPPLVGHIVQSVNPRVAVAESLPPATSGEYGGAGPRMYDDIVHRQPAAAGAAAPPASTDSTVSTAARAGPGPTSESGPVWKPANGSHQSIQVIRVRRSDGDSAGASKRSVSATASRQHQTSPKGQCGQSVVGRYTAPHLRQQQQLSGRSSEPGGGLGPGTVSTGAPQQAPAGGGHRPMGQVPDVPGPMARMEAAHPPQLPPPQQQQQQAGLQTQQQQDDVRRQLDDCLAALVAGEAWQGLGQSARKDSPLDDLHIAEKFRRAYEEQDARLRAKAAREAAAAQRYELRTSGAARALAQWLDQE